MSAFLYPAQEEEQTAIDQLLAEQRLLTPVARFAREHDEHGLPSKARYYRDLIPLSLPKPGEQYGFEVDLDKCSGCKACVTACHSLNGLDEEEIWRSVGFVHGGTTAKPFQQNVTTACHHCVDPGCLNGCPVLAYEKDPITGIVRHLDDQCIGCQYCILKCPYDVPKYNHDKGIVRKCDMCTSRLATGEAPACVQACPTQAIKIRIVNQADLVVASTINTSTTLVPGAPESHHTIPTTRYLTQNVIPVNALPADALAPKPETAHAPLATMLVLTQMSVGIFALDWLLRFGMPVVAGRMHAFLTLAAMVCGLAGLTASSFHLGRPLQAWRVFLGLRRSWLSREIVVFSGFAGFATVAGLSVVYSKLGGPIAGLLGPVFAKPAIMTALSAGVVLSGLAGVFCSAMIYVDTPRFVWRASQTGTKFMGTTLLLGLATALLAANVRGLATVSGGRELMIALTGGLVTVSLLKLGFEATALAALKNKKYSPAKRVAILLTGALKKTTYGRLALGLCFGVFLPVVLLVLGVGMKAPTAEWLEVMQMLAGFIWLGCVAGELAERELFFTAATGPKMPGGVA